MRIPTVGILHPGAMGAVVARQLVVAGGDVVWASERRSPASTQRAEDAGLRDAGTVQHVVQKAEVILSICPPAAAEDVAQQVASAGFGGLYVDANAIAPDTSRRIEQRVVDVGATYVDGSIVGGPPARPGTTRLYLAGDRADDVAAWFQGTNLGTVVLDGAVGAASALKSAYAGWSKGSGALLLALRAFARAEGVEDALVAEWAQSVPDALERSDRVAAAIHRKAWRYVGELRETGDALAAAGLPDGFHHAAAEVYARLADLKDEVNDQDPAAIFDHVLGTEPS